MSTGYVEWYEWGVLAPEQIKDFSEVKKLDWDEIPKNINSILELDNIEIDELNLKNTLEFNTKKVLTSISGYYLSNNTTEEWFLVTKKTEEEIKKYLEEWTFESDIVLQFHQAFNKESVWNILLSIKQLESKRSLTIEEKEVFDFINNIEQFFEELTKEIDNIKDIDFSRIKNVWYYSVKKEELEYSQKVLEMFNDFVEFINKSSNNYDFIINRLTQEKLINKEEEKVEEKPSKKWLLDFFKR